MTELSIELHTPYLSEQLNQTNDPIKSSSLTCRWKSCLRDFPDHISLSSHLSEDHIGWKKSGYFCDWDGCSRQGKQCHNRFALMMHLRIHTGEKPFECTWLNCGQTFGRMDALARHKKVEHGEEIKLSNSNPPSSRNTSSSSTTYATIKPKKPLKRASSSLDTLSKNKRLKVRKTLNSGDWSSGDESEDSLLTPTKVTPNPSKPLIPGSSYAQYRIAKAQLLYLIRENEMLQDEFDSMQKKLRRLKTERKVLLDAVMGAAKSEEEGEPIPDIEDQNPL